MQMLRGLSTLILCSVGKLIRHYLQWIVWLDMRYFQRIVWLDAPLFAEDSSMISEKQRMNAELCADSRGDYINRENVVSKCSLYFK